MAREMIDEIGNDVLATMTSEDIEFMGWDFRSMWDDELQRVNDTIAANILTGVDLRYWVERLRIVRQWIDDIFGDDLSTRAWDGHDARDNLSRP